MAAELAGEANQLADVLARVPTGRLVVLGEPGAGKTMLMVRLVLDVLARRSSGGRVPVLVSAASWDPSGQDLRAWLADQLRIGYPGLTAPAPPGSAGATRVEALLDEGFILPILDGLDEIPDAVRGPAIARINDAVRPGEHLVITSRTTPYQDAVRPLGGMEVTLRGAAGIALAALDADVVGSYLRRDAGGPSREALWDPVLVALSTRSALTRVLSTPLMVGLARAIYNPRPGEHAGALPDPAELCALAGDKAIESHLFDAFIPAAYRTPGTARRRPWSAGQAERWLSFLARHLEHTVGTPDFAWWQLARAMPRRVFATTVAVAAAILLSLPLSGLSGLPCRHLPGRWRSRLRSASCAASRAGLSPGGTTGVISARHGGCGGTLATERCAAGCWSAWAASCPGSSSCCWRVSSSPGSSCSCSYCCSLSAWRWAWAVSCDSASRRYPARSPRRGARRPSSPAIAAPRSVSAW